MIKREEIEKDIANEDYEQATNKLNESVQLYQKLKSDNTIYKEGYKPGTGEYKKYNQVRPTQDVYNQVECSEQLTKYYMQLLTLTNNKAKYSEYVHEISNQFIGSDALPGMLRQSKDVPLKKATSILNSLGNILLKLYDQKIDFQEFKDAVSKELQLPREANLTERDDLNIVKQIFTLAKAKGKQGDFTEADAYDGLRMVCDRQLKQGVEEEGQRKELLSYISAHKKARDEINKVLNRTIKYESDDESDVESTTTAATVPLTSSTSLLVNLAEDTAVQLNLMGADSVSHSDIGC